MAHAQAMNWDDIGESARNVRVILEEMQPNRSEEEKALVRQAILQIVEQHRLGGAQAAETAFKDYYNAFKTVANDNAVVAQAYTDPAAPPLSEAQKIAARLRTMDHTQMSLIASLTSNLPILGPMGKALGKLAQLEAMAVTFTGKPQVFNKLSDMIEQHDGALTQMGVNAGVSEIRSKVATGLAASTQAASALKAKVAPVAANNLSRLAANVNIAGLKGKLQEGAAALAAIKGKENDSPLYAKAEKTATR